MAAEEKDSWQYTGPETMTLDLKKPIKLGDKDPNTVTVLELREPTVGEMSAFLTEQGKSDDFTAGAVLISKVTGISRPQALAMGTRDFESALVFLTGFSRPLARPAEGNSES